MKINLTVETAEFNFIKHAIEQQTNQLVQYMDSMFKVATHLDRHPEDIEEEINSEAVVKAPKRRGRPPAKKRGRPAKAKV